MRDVVRASALVLRGFVVDEVDGAGCDAPLALGRTDGAEGPAPRDLVFLANPGFASCVLSRDALSTNGQLAQRAVSSGGAGNAAAAIATENAVNIPPTLRLAQGAELTVSVARDLDFSKVYKLERIHVR